jgi:hypothetical protein
MIGMSIAQPSTCLEFISRDRAPEVWNAGGTHIASTHQICFPEFMAVKRFRAGTEQIE